MLPFRFHVRRIAGVLLCCILASAGASACAHVHQYTETVIEPTCVSVGYTVHACACGETFYSDYQAKTPHAYGEWISVRDPGPIYGGEETRVCSDCGDTVFRETPCTSGLTRIYLTQRAGSLLYEMSYTGPSHRFDCSAELSVRTPDEDKPDYVLTMQTADTLPYEIDIGWGQTSVYCLNAYRTDPTHLREEICAHFWNQISSGHSASDPYLSDGSFPVQLYMNGSFRGLYMLSYPPGYHASSGRAAFVQNGAGSGSLFQSEPIKYGESATGNGFSYLSAPGSDREPELWESFQAFHAFVRESSDEDFVKHLKNYADADALADALLFSVLFHAGDAGQTGMIWHTDDGKKWAADFRSLECSAGISSSGGTVAPEYRLLIRVQEKPAYTGNSRLWERLTELFPEKLTERYALIREKVSAESVSAYFKALYDAIPPELAEAEKTVYPDAAEPANAPELTAFLTERFRRMDEVFRSDENQSGG